MCILLNDESDSSFDESWRGLLAGLLAEPGRQEYNAVEKYIKGAY